MTRIHKNLSKKHKNKQNTQITKTMARTQQTKQFQYNSTMGKSPVLLLGNNDAEDEVIPPESDLEGTDIILAETAVRTTTTTDQKENNNSKEQDIIVADNEVTMTQTRTEQRKIVCKLKCLPFCSQNETNHKSFLLL